MDDIEKYREEHRISKERYFSAKMGLSVFCSECHEEIYQPFPGIHPNYWSHKIEGRQACWCDPTDGVANPMSKGDLEDWYERIENEDWWLGDDTEE